MARVQVNRELIFMGSDLSRPRITVEREKLYSQFPNFEFYYIDGNRPSSIKGYLRTNFGNKYYVRIRIPDSYPYSIPRITLPYYTIDTSCPHKYSDKEICVMKSEQWTSTYSLAFMVARTAIWLNKYDEWKSKGKRRWPGKDQHR